MKSILILFLLFSICFNAKAQIPHDSDLFIKMKIQDSIFFERSFNLCDTEYLKKSIHKDLVFFHDKAGIQNRIDFLENVKKNLCANPNMKPIRKVEENSMEVYPLYNNNELYGVIQTGVHDFYIREPNKPDKITGKAKFSHV